MKNKLMVMVVAVIALTMLAGGAFAKGLGTDRVSRVPAPTRSALSATDFRGVRLETLWLYDEDFEDPYPDDWTSFDMSGTLGQTNYWHIDTIRTTEAYLGQYTWWCGTYNICWRQPRGYGNDWIQYLSIQVPGAGGYTLEWDQRYAMERNYDYGYVDVSSDGTTWTTIATYNNGGFMGAGVPTDWDGANGHVAQAIPAGNDYIRFRFESDGAYSSQDQYDNAQHSVKDGAWQLDNITIHDGAGDTLFFEDCEDGVGDPNWVHDDLVAHGQTGIQFIRGQYGPEGVYDFWTGRDFSCEDRDPGSYMMGAVDPSTSKMVDYEYSHLMSPPIWISGAEKLIGEWDMWVDLPRPSNDIFNLWLASNDVRDCVTDLSGFVDEDPGWWYGGPFWGVWDDDWDAFAGNDWLAILWTVLNDNDPGEHTDHMAGIFLNRQRVGMPSGDAGTTFERDTWNSFNDWFKEYLADALLDTALIKVKDDDGITSLYLLASNDDGATWQAYECTLESPESEWWRTPPPADQMEAGKEIHYYWEATDGVGNVATYPSGAPDSYFEFSILPLEATTTNPGILLVDKHGRRDPGAERNYRHSTEYYYREMLEILGYDWEVYDVEVPSGSIKSEGPDTAGLKYYHTAIYWFNDFNAYTLWPIDQYYLEQWLAQASGGKERNLLLTGNDVGYELMETGKETLGFYTTWLASQYVANTIGTLADTVPGLIDKVEETNPDFVFMNYDDGECVLAGACPDPLEEFDVVGKASGYNSNQVVADYIDHTGAHQPAGCAYTATSGYQTVNLGFGMEFMMDGTWDGGSNNYTAEGYFKTGISDRVNMMENIMTYFGLTPSGPGTGVDDALVANKLSQAYPNPFNPVTKIAYSVKQAGPVKIEVYNVAGKVVRTLLDTELDAGDSGYVVWDGTSDTGEKCASGVYFYRIAAPGFTEAKKMVMLK